MNNSRNVSTDLSSNKVIYDFNSTDNLSLLSDLLTEDFDRLRKIFRDKAKKFIVWVNVIAKTYYDSKHFTIELISDDQMYSKLYHDYTILDLDNKKLLNQRINSFKIVKNIDALAYWLNLLLTMSIHLVVFVAQLKSLFKESDSYNRSRSNNLFSVLTQNTDASSYEIERILKKKTVRNQISYLMK